MRATSMGEQCSAEVALSHNDSQHVCQFTEFWR